MSFKKRKVYALIPAKKKSSRLKNKNLLKIANKTLIQISIESSSNSQFVDKTFLSSDSDAILKLGKKFGAYPIKRKSIYSNPKSTCDKVILDFINNFEKKIIKQNPYIILLQPTSPLRTNKHINKAFIQLAKSKLINCVSFCKVKNKVLKTFIVKNKKIKPAFSERVFTANSEQLPETYIPNGAIYIFTIKEFLKKKKIPQNNIYPFIMSSTASVDIDNFDDFLEAKKNFNKCFIDA